ncbi:MAG: ABC transporter substrate-binding protein [Candidatus Vecturithrix sp.]|jgi:branched-chain amino acid transport system substrate-binding protein|nr:ABC transporter substrate-binding protein [Candidatus Vecturithrix sp.]
MKYLKGFTCLMSFILMLSWTLIGNAGEIVIGFTGPTSGPAAEYGQDVLNGIDLAVKDLNAAGGIKVKGQSYTFKLEKLDDRLDPTQAVSNARRFRANGAIAVWSPVFNCIAPLMKVNEEKGNEFLVMAYSATPKVSALGNKLTVNTVGFPFSVLCQGLCDEAWSRGWRKVAVMITLGAYGDEWRQTFKDYWQKIGGTVTIDKPANYYTETDFSSQLTAILGTKPDAIIVGGPSAPTALVMEQALNMGFKGKFILIDQSKMEDVARYLGGAKRMEGSIGLAPPEVLPVPGFPSYAKKYLAAYKKPCNWENVTTYTAMYALAEAIKSAGDVNDVTAIRAAFPKIFPILGDRFPWEFHGISDLGRFHGFMAISSVENGRFTSPVGYAWWTKSAQELENIKKTTKLKAPLKPFEIKVPDAH